MEKGALLRTFIFQANAYVHYDRVPKLYQYLMQFYAKYSKNFQEKLIFLCFLNGLFDKIHITLEILHVFLLKNGFFLD